MDLASKFRAVNSALGPRQKYLGLCALEHEVEYYIDEIEKHGALIVLTLTSARTLLETVYLLPKQYSAVVSEADIDRINNEVLFLITKIRRVNRRIVRHDLLVVPYDVELIRLWVPIEQS